MILPKAASVDSPMASLSAIRHQRRRATEQPRQATSHTESGSFGLGWFGILLLRLNLPEFIAEQLIIFKSFRLAPQAETVPK